MTPSPRNPARAVVAATVVIVVIGTEVAGTTGDGVAAVADPAPAGPNR
jgi:hypothetical protein